MVNQLVEKPEKAVEERASPFLRGVIAKIRSFKYIKIVAAAVILGLALLVVASVFRNINKSSDASASDPLRELELKLENILSDIKGAGSVKVMIMFDGGVELVVANTTSTTSNKTTDTSGGVERVTENTTETSSPVIINEGGASKPVVLKENLPRITGVMLVAEGADSVSVRMELVRAASRILGVDSNIIEIFVKAK